MEIRPRYCFLGIFSVIVFFLFLGMTIKETQIIVQTSDGLSKYSSPIGKEYFKEGEEVLVYGFSLREEVIPNKKEFFQETSIPERFFPIKGDTVLSFKHKHIFNPQKIKIGKVEEVIVKNLFGQKIN